MLLDVDYTKMSQSSVIISLCSFQILGEYVPFAWGHFYMIVMVELWVGLGRYDTGAAGFFSCWEYPCLPSSSKC